MLFFFVSLLFGLTVSDICFSSSNLYFTIYVHPLLKILFFHVIKLTHQVLILTQLNFITTLILTDEVGASNFISGTGHVKCI